MELQNAAKEVLSLDLKRIKDVTILPLKPREVMLEGVTDGDTGLLDERGKSIGKNNYWRVLNVGSVVTLCKKGDIVLDLSTRGANYLSKGKKAFLKIDESSLEVWTDPSNYDFDSRS